MRSARLAAVAIGLVACSSSGAPSGPVPLAVVPDWNALAAAPIAARILGHNMVWSRGGLGLWTGGGSAQSLQVKQLLVQTKPGLLRFPAGTRAMRWHFDQTIGPVASRTPQCDTFTGAADPETGYGLDEMLGLAAEVGADVTLVAPWVDGSPQEAAAMVAYANGDPASTVAIGVDDAGRDWGTAGSWAQRRAANGHAAAYGVKYVEYGNEPYLDLPSGPASGSCGRPSQFRQDERWVNGARIATTAKDYAAQLAKAGALIRAVDPAIRIGAPAASNFDGTDAAKALGDVDAMQKTGDAWNARVLSDARGAFDFFVLHPYDFTTTESRLQLAERLRAVVHDLRALAPDVAIGVTEFGFLYDGDTARNAIVSADVARVAAEEGIELVARHVFVEDTKTEPFATCALVDSADLSTSPAFDVERQLARSLPGARLAPIAAQIADVPVLATERDDGSLAIVALDRRVDPDGGVTLAVQLPPGAWRVEIELAMAPSTLDDKAPAPADVHPRFATNGALVLDLPPNGVALARLSPR